MLGRSGSLAQLLASLHEDIEQRLATVRKSFRPPPPDPSIAGVALNTKRKGFRSVPVSPLWT